ncbi:hypothetical protein CY35_10G041700 [Sphagnum magellanicum]|nr:hypothetical protein CY35_10G041700 [Sphagnum magellanicum]
MSPVDEELSAMLRSDLHQSPAQTTLASVMSSPAGMALGPGSEHMDSSTFSSHYSSSLEGGGLISSSSSGGSHGRQQLLVPPTVRGATNLSSVEVASSSHVLSLAAAAGPVQCSRLTALEQQQPPWPLIAADQKLLELQDPATKNQDFMKKAVNLQVINFSTSLLDATSMSLHDLNPPPPPQFSSRGGLQRYHSAPSSLLRSLAADCNNEDGLGFSSHQVSSPLGNNTGNITDDTRGQSLIPPFFSGAGNNNNNNLTSVTECVVQPMETDKMLNDSNLHQYDQFLSPATKSNKRASLVTTTSMFAGKPDSKPADLFGNQPQLGNDNLLRQSSLPADWLAAFHGSIDDTDPSSQMPSMTSPDESLSGRTSEDTAGVGVSGKSSIYSRDDSFLVIDTTSGGLWDSPTSPVGHIGGKRLRGILGDATIDTGEGLQRDRLGGPGTLIKHTSLPANFNRPTIPVLDDLADISVPCQTRAKRGCATHPRSIAERVRRTKISERMKRLQDLVPNMDKQTNMSDMLDEAVEYVKRLQQQVQDLSDTVAQLRDLKAKGLKAEGNGSSEV